MKAFVAILNSCGWKRFTFVYEDTYSTSTQVIPYLMEAIKGSGVEISNMVKLSPLAPTFSLLEELERISKDQCRVFLVHTSLEMGVRLFQSAKGMGMMERGYVWITTSSITNLLHTLNSSTLSMMEGVVGILSFFPDTSSQFLDFRTKFKKKFKFEQPEEENNMPGIFAVQAYDATRIVALSLSEKNMGGQKLLDRVSSISSVGITGKIQFADRRSVAPDIFQIINVIGKFYRELGFWSERLGFSEVINNRTTYEPSLQNLGHIFWPGRQLHTPRGWAVPTVTNPLRVGVPIMTLFKKFVEVKYDDSDHTYTYSGYSIELFKETTKRLPYFLPYEFHPFNGTYESLVKQVFLKKFDAVVGDVSVVSSRYEYVDFTHPYTERGLVMVVLATSYHGQWLFVKPFTLGMWSLTIMVSIYNGFVVWLIERKNSPELGGSALNRTGVLLSLAFTRLFFTHGGEVHSNLTRMTTVAWIFAAIIIGQCYTASLTSMLTVKRLIPKVTDFEMLKKANSVVGYHEGAHVAKYLEDVLGFKHTNIKPFNSPEQYAQALKNREIAAVFLEVPFVKLFLAKYCKSFVTAGPTFGEGGFAFVLPKGSPMLHDLTKALLNVSESGVLQHIEKIMIGSEQCVDLDPVDDEYESLGVGSFWSLLLMTGGTSTVALVVYVFISLRNYYQIGWSIISDVKNYFAHPRKRFSRKVSDLGSPKSLNLEMTYS